MPVKRPTPVVISLCSIGALPHTMSRSRLDE
jgi:hypothetical protein